MGRKSIYKKIILLILTYIFFINHISANRGNSLTYNVFEFDASHNDFQPQIFIDNFSEYLCATYSVKANFSEKTITKYNLKKIVHYAHNLYVKKQNMFIQVYIHISQRQPYLFYRNKKNDYNVYIELTRFIHDYYDKDYENLKPLIDELNDNISIFLKENASPGTKVLQYSY